jgi:hypothetical protein
MRTRFFAKVSDYCMSAWKDAATEHIKLRSMFTTRAPYQTIYIDRPIRCSEHRILNDLYSANGQPRTAPAFVCPFPDGECEPIDVVNVHAPSGVRKLKDTQRMALLTSLLQSNSQAVPGGTIGNARFLIGGDMNTSPYSMSQMLSACRAKGSLRTTEKIHESGSDVS